MESPVTDELAGATNALIIGALIAVVGVGVLLWVVRLCVRAVGRAIRQRIREAKSKHHSDNP